MFTELRIRNFRLFEDLTIRGLRRINLFVGKNNSGKSAAVEAVALVAGGHDPRVPYQLYGERGMKVPTTEHAFEHSLRCLFRDLDASRELSVTVKHLGVGRRTVKASIEHVPVDRVPTGRSNSEPIGDTPTQAVLAVRLENDNGGYRNYRTFLLDDDIKVDAEVSAPPHGLSLDYVPTNLQIDSLTLDRLSELRKRKKAGLVLDVLRQIEPRLEDVPEVLMEDGVPNLFCDIGIGKLIPLGLMGQGLARVLRLVVVKEPESDNANGGGIMIIDEVENGIHHESMVEVWRALGAVAHRCDKQIFATTHSYECLASASDAIDNNDLAVHRLEVDGDRTMRCVTLDAAAVEGVLSNGFEVR